MNKITKLVNRRTFAVLPLLALLAVDAQAKPRINPEPGAPAPEAPAPLTAEEFKQALKDAKARSAKRNPANDSFYENGALSWQMRNLRNELIGGPAYNASGTTGVVYPGLKVPEDIKAPDFAPALENFHKFFQKLNDDAYYNNLQAPDAQWAAAQMAGLVVFRGFANRTQDLFQDANLSHAGAVTAMRALAAGIYTYLPTDQWKAGYRYYTYPTTEWKFLIDSEDKVHLFIEQEAIPALVKLSQRLERLNFGGKAVYFDNQILYGVASFDNPKDQYMKLGEAERKAALAGTYATVSGLMSLTSYNLNGLLSASDTIARKYGIGATFNANQGSARERFEVLRKANAKDGLFRFRGEQFRPYMTNSWKWLVKAAEQAKLSWAELGCLSGSDGATETNSCEVSGRNPSGADRSNAQGNLFDPRTFMTFNRVFSANINNLEYILHDRGETLQSVVVAGEGVKVNIKKFYDSPPPDLTIFFPKAGAEGFDPGPYNVLTDVVYKPSSDKGLLGSIRDQSKIRVCGLVPLRPGQRCYHNYLEGTPKNWDSGAFTQYFQVVGTSPFKGENDVRRIARVTGQAWGGWLVGVPISALMF